ncbi:threonine--tRNA ligase, partial [Patescibacteria group bacterium]|nr:threonine--tRNA ligase [Patescibacteria group bacterium]
GFYHDFDPSPPAGGSGQAIKVSEEDFPKIEKEMQRLIDADFPMIQENITPEKARSIFKDNSYKLEWIDDIEKRKEKVSIYTMGDEDLDLCSGPHAKSTGEIRAFKLLSVAGAYWHGDEKNKMLTRIYGTAFPTQKELDEYLALQEEAKKRDHRKIGKELKLYLISDEIGPGLILWKPNGAIIRHEMEKFIMEEQTKRGYKHVFTPHIGKKQLWVTSGHWDLYRDKMYTPMQIDDVDYMVKPMNCPMHMMIYKSEQHSYKDLPLRLAEDASVYRYEQAGELSGMVRGRHFTQDDAHIFCTDDQVTQEFVEVMDYAFYFLESFGIKDYYMQLSIRDPKNKSKYLGSDDIWKNAENKIKKAVEKKRIQFTLKEGEAAFYGPKLDFMIKDALGRVWQCGTIQIDFMLPERFNLEYIASDGQVKQPVVIHRAIAGSLERFFSILVEHFGGAFPTWLTPVQVKVLPIADRHIEYAKGITEQLKNKNIRAELDDRKETLQAKIRDSQMEKVSYMLIVGDKEIFSHTVAKRGRNGKDYGQVALDEFISAIRKEIDERLIV